MMPPIFPALNASAQVKALLGSAPLRAYAFGMAPQNVVRPYLVWQIVAGVPENYLGDRPDVDGTVLQIDVYAGPGSDGAASARACALAARDAIEGWAHITSWRGESRDPETMNYRSSFDTAWVVNR